MNPKPPQLIPLAAIALLAASACNAVGDKSSGAHNDTAAAPVAMATQNNVVPDDLYLITNGSAGPFTLGAPVPDRLEGFLVTEATDSKIDSEGQTFRLPVHIYEIGNEGWVKITPRHNPAKGCTTGEIGEIFIYSDLFLTDRGIGAMSSVEEFAAAYPDFTIEYSDFEELFIVSAPQLRNVQFLINDDCYNGARPIPSQQSSEGLKTSDFKANSCFTAIRLI